MQINREVKAAIVTGAVVFGLSALGARYGPSLVDRFQHLLTSHQAKAPVKPDPRALEQFVQNYNSATIPEKANILMRLYNQRYGYNDRGNLVRVTYDNQHEMFHDHYPNMVTGGYVTAGVDFGVLQTTSDSGGISLNNIGDIITIDGQGNVRPFSVNGDNTLPILKRNLNIPKGFSLLAVESQTSSANVDELVRGLRRFAENNPSVGIDEDEIGVIRRETLKNLRY